jgi:RNA polymerase sigma factor (sigma-70 family)
VVACRYELLLSLIERALVADAELGAGVPPQVPVRVGPDLRLPICMSDHARDELFETAVADHGAALWRLTAGYAREQADREDLLQDILVAILGALPSFRRQSSLRTFVYRIGHNIGITYRRRRTRTPMAVPLDALASDAPSPESEAIASISSERLMAAIRELPHGRRQVVMLSLEGFDNAGIGEVLGISANNAAVRLHRARGDLRRLLERHPGSMRP